MNMRDLITLYESTQASIETVKSAAAKLGVEMDVFEAPEWIELHWLERKGGQPGAGAEAMNILCAYANEKRKKILLQVENEQLGAYYSEWGFDEMDSDEFEDNFPDWDEILVRYPS